MAAVQYDLHIDRGSTARTSIQWLSPDGTPINLTGYRVLFQFRKYAQAVAALVSFDSAALTAGQTIGTLSPTGTVDFSLSDELTELIPEGIHVWDILVESPTGVRDKLAYGLVYVSPDVTRGP